MFLELAQSHKLPIQFLGRINDVNTFYDSLNLLVVPSIREPLGNVIIEAGIRKIPVIASNVDGISEIIEHNITGLLIKPSKPLSLSLFEDTTLIPDYTYNPESRSLQPPCEVDPELLAHAITKYHRERELARYHAEKLHLSVKNKFSINHYLIAINSIYKDLFGSPE